MVDIMKSANIDDASSNYKTHEFSKTVFGTEILFAVLKMEQSALIWIGLKDQKLFSDLSLGFQSRFSDMPLSTHLLGNCSHIISKTFTSKLAKKLDKPVYLSYNVPDDQMTPAIIKTLITEIDAYPDRF